MLPAYADDLALVAVDIEHSARIFSRLSRDVAENSGLPLNLAKTVFLPLGDLTAEDLRRRIEHPGWGSAAFALNAEYFGFALGPEVGHKVWNKSLSK